MSSTILDITRSQPRILRTGYIRANQIEEIRSTPGTGFFNDEDMIALNLPSKTIDYWMSNGGPLSMKIPKGIIKKKIKVKNLNTSIKSAPSIAI